MDFNHNIIKGCPLCEIFLHPSEKKITKLYYPNLLDEINKVDFIIVDCKDCKVPMVVLRDHITDTSKEIWGRMLFKVRGLFGDVRLRCKPGKVHDHFHCHIVQNIRRD